VSLRRRVQRALGAVVLGLLSPVIVVAVALYLFYGLALVLAIWLAWAPRGKYILFVYSDSPLWRDQLLRQVLPPVERHAVVLNWSERRRWSWVPSLAVMAFRFFGGAREFNPLAVVLRPFHIPRRFRFWRPFQHLKHGRREPLDEMVRAFWTAAQAWRAPGR
jgi:hypothetical protein